MKKHLTLLSVFMFVAFVQFAKADPANYYVTNGEPFSLNPTGGSSLAKLIWTIDGTDIHEILGSTNGGILTHTFTDAVGTIKLHTISLKVLETLDGCLSDAIDYNVIVLPKITVTIAAPGQTNFCIGTVPDLELTASVSVIDNLLDYGVTISPFTWKKGSTTLSEVTGTLQVTAAGVYEALVSYVLPGTGGTYPPTASKLINYVTAGSQEILNNLPLPSVPAITLN